MENMGLGGGPVDDWTRPAYREGSLTDSAENHKLGLLFETQVGPGRLLVCTADLPGLNDRPEARQLLASLLHGSGM